MRESRLAGGEHLRSRAARSALVVALAAAALVLPTGPARALPADVPVETWVTNGNVNAVTRAGGRVYLGGLFDQVGPSTGFGVALDQATGQRVAGFPKVNGEVFVAVSDGAGGWFIGGDFTRVGALSRHNAAQIKSNGEVGPWNPNTNFPVRAIVRGGASERIFLGGDFNTLRGLPCAGLAMTDATGNPTCLAQAAGGTVSALVLSPDGGTLYVGGGTDLAGVGRLAAVSATSGAPLPGFNPSPNGAVSALAASPDGARLYVGGAFTVMAGQPRKGLAVLNPAGALDPAWTPDTDGTVSALALSPVAPTLYVGGSFSKVGGKNHDHLAAIDTTGTGSVDEGFKADAKGFTWPFLLADDPLLPRYDGGSVTALALSGDGSRLHVGGFFAKINGQDHRFLAAVNPTTGALDATFDAAPGQAVLALALSADGARLFAGGLFTSTGGARRSNLAALHAGNGELDTSFTADANKAVNAIAVDGTGVYVGGFFTTIDAQQRSKVAKLDLAGTPVPTWRASVSGEVKALVVTPTGRLVLGGTFTDIDGQPRGRLASLSGVNGNLEAWNPTLAGDRPGDPSGVYDLDLSPDGSLVYVGGSFTKVGATNRKHLASFRLDTGALTDWAPPANDVLRRVAVSPDGQRVFAGLGGGLVNGNRVQAFSAAGVGPLLWEQKADGDFTGLDVSTSVVYAGGHFNVLRRPGNSAGDLARQHLAAFDQLTGAPLTWGPPIAGVLGVLDIEVTPGSILIAGEFHKVGVGDTQVVAQSFASFPWPGDPDLGSPTTAPPTTTPPTTTPPTTQPPGPAAAGRSGYWLVSSDGEVYPFGDAADHGDARAGLPGGARAVDLEATPAGRGYWIIDDRGDVFAFGDASSHGGVEGVRLTGGETVTSLSATPSGRGYWIFTSRGRAIARGDAIHHGDMSATVLNGPVLDSIPTPSGQGYYMVASDGGIFAFGDAQFFGSMGGKPLNQPVQSLVPDPDRAGYWLVASDGGVFAFGAPFRGSMGGKPLNKPMTGMVPYGNGYLMVAEDGGIFVFSDRPFSGSLGSSPPARPVVSVAALQA